MQHKSFGYTALALGFLEKLLGTRFSLHNLEKVPKDQPVMFVANHFTRSETFFLPPQKKRRMEHGITAMLLGPAFSASGMPRVEELREQGKKSWRGQRHGTSRETFFCRKRKDQLSTPS